MNDAIPEVPVVPTFENTKPTSGQTTRGAILTRTQRNPKPNNMGIPAGVKAPPTPIEE